MAGRTPLDNLMANGTILPVVLTGQTTNATIGTRSTHAHGLTNADGVAITPAYAIPIPTATDVDATATGMLTGAIHVVKMDATNVTVRCEVASQTFTLLVF